MEVTYLNLNRVFAELGDSNKQLKLGSLFALNPTNGLMFLNGRNQWTLSPYNPHISLIGDTFVLAVQPPGVDEGRSRKFFDALMQMYPAARNCVCDKFGMPLAEATAATTNTPALPVAPSMVAPAPVVQQAAPRSPVAAAIQSNTAPAFDSNTLYSLLEKRKAEIEAARRRTVEQEFALFEKTAKDFVASYKGEMFTEGDLLFVFAYNGKHRDEFANLLNTRGFKYTVAASIPDENNISHGSMDIDVSTRFEIRA